VEKVSNYTKLINIISLMTKGQREMMLCGWEGNLRSGRK